MNAETRAAYSNEFIYRGFTIRKIIRKTGATVYFCQLDDGLPSRSTNAARILSVIDQKLAQEFLNESFAKVDTTE
jgi:hypothetical protein